MFRGIRPAFTCAVVPAITNFNPINSFGLTFICLIFQWLNLLTPWLPGLMRIFQSCFKADEPERRADREERAGDLQPGVSDWLICRPPEKITTRFIFNLGSISQNILWMTWHPATGQ